MFQREPTVKSTRDGTELRAIEPTQEDPVLQMSFLRPKCLVSERDFPIGVRYGSRKRIWKGKCAD